MNGVQWTVSHKLDSGHTEKNDDFCDANKRDVPLFPLKIGAQKSVKNEKDATNQDGRCSASGEQSES